MHTFFCDCVVKQCEYMHWVYVLMMQHSDGAASRVLMWLSHQSPGVDYVTLKVQCCVFQFQLDKNDRRLIL